MFYYFTQIKLCSVSQCFMLFYLVFLTNCCFFLLVCTLYLVGCFFKTHCWCIQGCWDKAVTGGKEHKDTFFYQFLGNRRTFLAVRLFLNTVFISIQSLFVIIIMYISFFVLLFFVQEFPVKHLSC